MTTRLERRVKSWDEIAPTRPPTSNPFRLLVDRDCQLRPPYSIGGLHAQLLSTSAKCTGNHDLFLLNINSVYALCLSYTWHDEHQCRIADDCSSVKIACCGWCKTLVCWFFGWGSNSMIPKRLLCGFGLTIYFATGGETALKLWELFVARVNIFVVRTTQPQYPAVSFS